MPVVIIRSLIADAGVALFGDSWQSELARHLGVSDRTMRRWINGDTTPDGAAVLNQLVGLARRRLSAIAKLRNSLEAARRQIGG